MKEYTVKDMDDSFNEGVIFALTGVKDKIETIITELKNKGFDEPKGFSVLKGYIDDTIIDYESVD